MPAVRRPGIGFVLAVLLSMFLAVAAQAQTDTSSGTASTAPTLTISASRATATEGDEVTYTVTAGSAPSSALPVVVHVRAHGEVMDTRTVAEVLLPAGSTTVTLRLEEFTDEIAESPVNVTLTLAGGTGYSVGDPAEATVSIDYPSDSDAQATPAPTPTPAVSPPDAPSGVSISAPSMDSFTVSWTAEAGKTYRLEREAAFLFSYRVWQTVADNVSSGSFTESGLPCDLYYVYRVQAKVAGSAFGAGTRVLGPAQACQSSPSSGARTVRAVGTPMPQLRIVTDNPEQDRIQIRLLLYGSPDEVYNPIRNMDMFQVDRSERYAGSGDPVFPSPAIRREERVAEFDWGGLECGSSYYFRARGHGNGESDGFTDEWGKWSHEPPREAQGTVHGSTRGCTLSPPPAPGNVRASVDLPNAQVTVSWNAVSGAASYKLERGHGDLGVQPTTVEWPDPNNTDHRDRIITDMFVTSNDRVSRTVNLATLSLPCGPDVVYSFRVSAYGNDVDYLEEYGPTEEATFGALTTSRGTSTGRSTARAPTQSPLCTPDLRAPVIDVIPLPQRSAQIRWGVVLGADTYIVEAREKQSGDMGWVEVRSDSHTDKAKTAYDISLDEIVPFKGLADHPYEYQFRVKAKDSSGAVPESDYSDVITIVDSPIKSVNGDSREGEMKIRWHTAGSGAQYTVRWRKISNKETNSHTSENWRPVEWRSSHAGSEYDWDSETTSSHSYDIDNEDRGIVEGEIYAVQLNYTVGSQRYFSARERYAWVSDRRGGYSRIRRGGERVGNYPLGFPLNDPLAPNNKTYAYRICADTFSSVEARQNEWIALIEHALEQWELATDGLVKMDPVMDQSGNRAPCVRYQDDVDPVLARLYAYEEGLLGEEIEINITTISEFINTLSYVGDFVKEDRERNEIVMVNLDLQRITEFEGDELWEFSSDLGLSDCVFTSSACAHTVFVGHDILGNHVLIPYVTTRVTTDILLPSDYRNDSLVVPPVTFNTCSGTYSKAYEKLVHEGGHALGIGSGDWFQKDLDPNTVEAYLEDHPPLVDSVMNYDQDSKALLVVYETIEKFREPDCSPHPMDIMAIFALYQTFD